MKFICILRVSRGRVELLRRSNVVAQTLVCNLGVRLHRLSSQAKSVPPILTAGYAAPPGHFSKPLVGSGPEPDHIFWIVIDTMITGPAVRPYDTEKPWFS